MFPPFPASSMELPDRITGITDLAQAFAGAGLKPGDTAVDCTAGNGLDTLFLLQKTAPGGFVFAFDVQKDALKRTRALLEDACISSHRFKLVHDCHSRLSTYVKQEEVAVCMFNLGFLPGGTRDITTSPGRVIEAVRSALGLLRPLGLITIVMYPGHEPGRLEQKCILDHVRNFDERLCRVMYIRYMNTEKASPSILVIQKLPA